MMGDWEWMLWVLVSSLSSPRSFSDICTVPTIGSDGTRKEILRGNSASIYSMYRAVYGTLAVQWCHWYMHNRMVNKFLSDK